MIAELDLALALLNCIPRCNNSFLLYVKNKTVKPKKVEIVPGATYLEAAKVQQLQCKATGGNPPAVVTWWMNNVQLKNVEIIVSGSFPST